MIVFFVTHRVQSILVADAQNVRFLVYCISCGGGACSRIVAVTVASIYSRHQQLVSFWGEINLVICCLIIVIGSIAVSFTRYEKPKPRSPRSMKHSLETSRCRCDHGAVIMYPRSISVSFVSKHEATGWSCCIPEASSTRETGHCRCDSLPWLCIYPRSIIVSFVSKHETLEKLDEAVVMQPRSMKHSLRLVIVAVTMELSLCTPEVSMYHSFRSMKQLDEAVASQKHQALVGNWSLSLWRFAMVMYLSLYHSFQSMKHSLQKTGWSCRYATQKHEALVAKLVVVAVTIELSLCTPEVSLYCSFRSMKHSLLNRMKLLHHECETGHCRYDGLGAVIMYPRSIVVSSFRSMKYSFAKLDEAVIMHPRSMKHLLRNRIVLFNLHIILNVTLLSFRVSQKIGDFSGVIALVSFAVWHVVITQVRFVTRRCCIARVRILWTGSLLTYTSLCLLCLSCNATRLGLWFLIHAIFFQMPTYPHLTGSVQSLFLVAWRFVSLIDCVFVCLFF